MHTSTPALSGNRAERMSSDVPINSVYNHGEKI